MSTKPLKILIAEDSTSQCEIIASRLDKLPHEFVMVTEGLGALHALEHGEYDMAILDWIMPGMSGIDVSRRIKGLKPSLYVVVMTARDEEDREEAISHGADDYLTKPYKWVELLARIQLGERILRLQEENKMLRRALLQEDHSGT